MKYTFQRSKMKSIIMLMLSYFILNAVYAQNGNPILPAVTQPIPLHQLEGYEHYPAVVKNLIHKALVLSQKNLTYRYGSADPGMGGMDCSGTMYYLLKHSHVNDVPRDTTEMYEWAKKNGKFHSVTRNDFNSSEFSQLKPGDLLFWSGTYTTLKPKPITHVMLYLGKNQQGKLLMFGSSDGRTYQGKKMWGVSVFDFVLPAANSKSRFVGYGCIPTLTCD